jgi:F-type H+-transporting ATPase subunit delta
MKISKSALSTARGIMRLCSDDGQLNEQNLRTAISRVVETKPRGYRGILAGLVRLVRAEEKRKQVTVESARFLDPATEQRVRDNLTQTYGPGLNFQFRTNPDLMGGMRIRVGDDVIDSSVQARIQRLENAFS